MSVLIDASVILLLAGGGTCFAIAALGLVRMPDLYTRMQATSKAGTLGALLVLAGCALHLQDGALAVRAGLIGLFLALTGPVGAHMLARAGYVAGVRMSDPDGVDELEGRYEGPDHRLPRRERPGR